ncbi:receptor-like protein kinase FERONIA [Vigna umbellata]|uniref:receptor-like protein kinase FERONIA n=1 Tax=Vigna umbellata TaxID=87088 RepID=UPI001F5E5830|nr:receptor-like protein kinase FERONIA [Vigna umbellata]
MRSNAVIFFLLHLFSHLQAYTLVDNFTISCGSSGTSYDGQRTWTGDIGSPLLTNEYDTVSAKATTQSPSINQVPYATARLSHSEFSYSFYFSTGGPKFLRLFFFPASYPSYSRTQAFFSVHSNQFILLQDFNASLNADAQAIDTIFREYVVNVKDGESLILTFTPSHPNSYAFINGIEVLSMPTDLYYTPLDDPGFTLVGHDTLFSVGSSTAMETVYRIKTGGQEISPKNDTGLFRNWADEKSYFIKHSPRNDDLPADMDGKMNITVNPDYLAPKELFRTARIMGTNATLNRMSNLTWEFPVDYGFTYVLRLHFCELDPNINNIGDRRFSIYIGSQLADSRADVMVWSQKQKGLAVQKNYAFLIPENSVQKKYNLSLQMHPYGSSVYSRYSDAFLNGLEIFKISDTRSNNLAGPNPEPIETSHQKENRRSRSKNLIIGNTVKVVSGVVFILLVLFFIRLLTTSKWSAPLFLTTKSTKRHNFSLPSGQCRRFSLVEIKAATKNFNNVLIVGDGGFGHVYKGYIDDGSVPVAIKRLRQGSQQGASEFVNEIQMLSQLRHRHLLSLIGYCCDNNEMILVYEFMRRGNLREHLYGTDNPPLSWKQRLKICVGAARGLRYLHTGANHMIIHRDVKTTNILLDEKWVAKVSDFGLSKIGPNEMSKSHVSTVVKGSFGYLDPEYYIRRRLTEKSDVYSFGVVLFEVLCARSPLIHTEEIEQVSLANWARYCCQNGTVTEIVDPILKGKIAPDCLAKFCEIGVSCLSQEGMQRPSMNDVVLMLESALKLQESADQGATQEAIDHVLDLGEHHNSCKDNDKLMLDLFSEIVDLEPR